MEPRSYRQIFLDLTHSYSFRNLKFLPGSARHRVPLRCGATDCISIRSERDVERLDLTRAQVRPDRQWSCLPFHLNGDSSRWYSVCGKVYRVQCFREASNLVDLTKMLFATLAECPGLALFIGHEESSPTNCTWFPMRWVNSSHPAQSSSYKPSSMLAMGYLDTIVPIVTISSVFFPPLDLWKS